MKSFENLITSINPDAYGKSELKAQAERLIGTQAIEFLTSRDIHLEPYEANKHATFSFKYLDREVFIRPTETEDKVHGVHVDYWMDDAHADPAFTTKRFVESRDTLEPNTLAFLRFLGDFVEKIDTNLVVNPSDEQRERLYTSFFATHGPIGHNVYMDDRLIIKKESAYTPSV